MAFYTYLWLREDGTPSYAGKGKGRRAFRRGAPPLDRIILQDFESEQDALDAERFLISFYGRKDLGTGCLRNLTEGGEGIRNLSAITRKKMSESFYKHPPPMLGRKLSTAHRSKLSEAHKGQIPWHSGIGWTAEQRAKISASKKGKRYLSDQHYENLSKQFSGSGNPFFGKKHSSETIQKLSTSLKGRSVWNKGIPCSEEMKKRLSAALKGKPRGVRT